MANHYIRNTVLEHGVNFWNEDWLLACLWQVEQWEHEHFVNMVVNYGLTVTTEDETFIQDFNRLAPQGRR